MSQELYYIGKQTDRQAKYIYGYILNPDKPSINMYIDCNWGAKKPALLRFESLKYIFKVLPV